MPGTFSPPSRVSDPDMHHGTCVMHVPWCMLGSLTSGFPWSRLRGKRFRHSRRMRKQTFYVSGKRLIVVEQFWHWLCISHRVYLAKHAHSSSFGTGRITHIALDYGTGAVWTYDCTSVNESDQFTRNWSYKHNKTNHNTPFVYLMTNTVYTSTPLQNIVRPHI